VSFGAAGEPWKLCLHDVDLGKRLIGVFAMLEPKDGCVVEIAHQPHDLFPAEYERAKDLERHVHVAGDAVR
jgi:hypothetical protein